MVNKKDFESWAEDSKCYAQLKVVDKHLRVVADMNDSKSWAQGSRCYE